MGVYEFEFKQTGQLLYVDGKEDGFLKDEEQLYRRYWGKLMGVASRYVVDRETAREVVNDSFVKAFDRLADFRGEGPDKQTAFSAWLVRITVNTAIDRLRVQRNMPEMTSLDRLEHHPGVEMDDRLQLDDMLLLLEGLPDMHRIVFNLYELEGYKHDEIAELLQIPASSSRVYLTKAKQRLRALYNTYFGGRNDG